MGIVLGGLAYNLVVQTLSGKESYRQINRVSVILDPGRLN